MKKWNKSRKKGLYKHNKESLNIKSNKVSILLCYLFPKSKINVEKTLLYMHEKESW